MKFASDCFHNEACWGIEGVLWTYGCTSCGRVGYGPTLKLAKEAFGEKRELTSHCPNKEAEGLENTSAGNGAPKEESDETYVGYYVKCVHGGEDW